MQKLVSMATGTGAWRTQLGKSRSPQHASGYVRPFQKELCTILDTNTTSLQTLTVDMYSNYIIDISTKNFIMRALSFATADVLFDRIELELTGNPRELTKVLSIMEKQEVLKTVVQRIRARLVDEFQPTISKDEKIIVEDHSSKSNQPVLLTQYLHVGWNTRLLPLLGACQLISIIIIVSLLTLLIPISLTD